MIVAGAIACTPCPAAAPGLPRRIPSGDATGAGLCIPAVHHSPLTALPSSTRPPTTLVGRVLSSAATVFSGIHGATRDTVVLRMMSHDTRAYSARCSALFQRMQHTVPASACARRPFRHAIYTPRDKLHRWPPIQSHIGPCPKYVTMSPPNYTPQFAAPPCARICGACSALGDPFGNVGMVYDNSDLGAVSSIENLSRSDRCTTLCICTVTSCLLRSRSWYLVVSRQSHSSTYPNSIITVLHCQHACDAPTSLSTR
jgi:hypothetical protein